MDELKEREHPQSRVKKGLSTFHYIAIVIVIVFAISLYYYIKNTSSTSSVNTAGSSVTFGDAQPTDQDTSQLPGLVTTTKDEQKSQRSSESEENASKSDTNSPLERLSTTPLDSPESEGVVQIDPSASSALRGLSDQTQQQPSIEGNPQQLINEINSFYTHLDQQPYMQSFGLKRSSKEYFSKLIQKLANNPPVIFGETNDLFTLLQNTSHFFRVLGKGNINILREMLNKEKASFEPILKAFYGLASQPEYLQKEYSISIPPKVFTDYAAFFLNTMGGRLYLFRRDSTSRMVVSYYSIITIDRAKSQGNGSYGIDLRPAINSLVEEMENGGKRLQFKDEYLDKLYDLQEKYN